MSNSVNNLKNSVFYLFLLCFLSSCVVEERHNINEHTGLEWTFKKYRNGTESITIAGQTVRGDYVRYFFGRGNMFNVVDADSSYIYNVIGDKLQKFVAIPRKGLTQPVSIFGKPKEYETITTIINGEIFCSENKDFWIQEFYLNGDESYFDLYLSNGKFIKTVTECRGVAIYNKFYDDYYPDYYSLESDGMWGVYTADGEQIIPIKYNSVRYKYWSFGGEVTNLYYFIAQRDEFEIEGDEYYKSESPTRFYDIYSKSGELLLAIDNKNEICVANQKQYKFENWKTEFKSADSPDGGLWDEIEDKETFKGYTLVLLKEYEKYHPEYDSEYWAILKHSYYLTMIEGSFYIIHKYEDHNFDYIVESIKIPIRLGNDDNASIASGKKQTVTTVPVQRFKACPSCLGGGLCSYCNGSGIYYHPGGSAPCAVCGGFGRCSMCAGRGGEYITEYEKIATEY